MTTETDLTAQGWERQTTYDEPRLSEMAETYRELGFEVRLEPFDATGTPACTDCMSLTPERFRTIWIRRPPGGD